MKDVKEKFSVAILPVGMLLVVVVSMLNYPIEVIEEVFEYLNEKQVAATVQTTTDETQEATTVTEALVQEVSVSETPVESTQVQTEPLYTKVYQKVITIRDKIESKLNDISFKNMYVCLNTFLEHTVMGKVEFIDAEETVVLMENGYLSLVREKAEDIDVTLYADNLIALTEYLSAQGTDFLYVQAPHKNSIYDDQYPDSVEEICNDLADELIAEIDGEVNWIDLRVEMYKDGMNQYDYYFKTDHHWTPEAGFWAVGTVAELLSSDYGFEIDSELLNIENYNIDVYENWFLGSEGKRVGEYIAGTEDISLIYPSFETSFIFEVPSENIYREGSFEDVMFDDSNIIEIDYYNVSAYSTYIGTSYQYASLVNLQNTEGKKVLLLWDSYGQVFAPYLALCCSQLDTIDLRAYKEESLMEFLSENEYDMVIMLKYPYQINTEGFTFDEIY